MLKSLVGLDLTIRANFRDPVEAIKVFEALLDLSTGNDALYCVDDLEIKYEDDLSGRVYVITGSMEMIPSSINKEVIQALIQDSRYGKQQTN